MMHEEGVNEFMTLNCKDLNLITYEWFYLWILVTYRVEQTWVFTCNEQVQLFY